MSRKFPKLNEDGSFSFDAYYVFNDSQSLTPEQLNAWIQDWVKNSDPWVREWSSGREEVLNFYESFFVLPKVIDIDSGCFSLRFEGKPNAPYWKDWFAKFSSSLISCFAEVRKLSHTKSNSGM